MTGQNKAGLALIAAAALMVPASTLASDAGVPSAEVLKGLYPGKEYSPYAQRNFPNNVYWGDTHLHTSLSLDAGLFGNTLDHDDAYRFAKGEEVTSSTGLKVKLGRPLDWLVITDHSDMMGLATDIQRGAPNILKNPKGKEWAEGFKRGGTAAGEAAFDLITHFAQGKVPEQFLNEYSPGSTVYDNLWQKIIDTEGGWERPSISSVTRG